MAVSKNTKKKYQSSLNPYSQSEYINSLAKKLAALSNSFPVYQNTYADRLSSIYKKIKDGKSFEYSPENDAAYRRFADEYNALAGLAIAANQQQAQGLTGGFGSSYASEVASQGLKRLEESASAAAPLFMEQAQNAFIANNDLYKSIYDAAASARNDELSAYGNAADLFNARYAAAQKKYQSERDFSKDKFDDNRSFWETQYKNEVENDNFEKLLQFKKYDTYGELAENKCAEYNSKKNNKGMKKYLEGLVEQDKITGYMADKLYRKYKYVAPSYGSSRSYGRGSKSKSSSSDLYDFNEFIKNWSPNERIIKFINLNNRKSDYETAINWINTMVKDGRIDPNEKLLYAYYYRDMYSKKKEDRWKK